MSKIQRIKSGILKLLYGSSDKTLLDSDWNKLRWTINRRKIVIWGVNSQTQKYINSFYDKIDCIVDEHPQNWTTNYSGLYVMAPDVISEFNPNEVVFVVLSEKPDSIVSFLRSKKQNLFFCPCVMDKRKYLLRAYRSFKNFLKGCKSAIKKFLLLPYTCIFDKLVEPETIVTYKTLGYKAGNSYSKKFTWRKFNKIQKGKKIVIFGYCRAAERFIQNSKADRIIDRCYTFEPNHINKEYMGIPIKSIEHFEFNNENEVLLIAYNFYYSTQAAADFVEEQGIETYYCINSMKAKTIKFQFFKPLYLLRRWYSILKKRNGIFRNYILFPIKGFLRMCHIPFFYRPYQQLKSYKNKFKGKRCFIVCTGTSLTVEDVERLKNEFTFGVNTIYKMFNKTTWRPTFYCVCDPNFYNIHKNRDDMKLDNFCVEKAFITDYYKKRIDTLRQTRVQYVPVNYLDQFCKGENISYKYSKNLIYGSYNASTVANFCINLAQYMGFDEIYLLGADCNYSMNASYFDGSKNSFTISIPNVYAVRRLMLEGYSFVKKNTDKLGIKVYNATRGGRLEIFPRVNFDTLFPYENAEFNYALMPDGSENPITVSVNVLTYFHEKYIRQSLDSIIMQKTKFRYEINIGDDCSTDSTQEIIKEYVNKYPHLFNICNFYESNIGIQNNAYNLFVNARGKYIAYLDGDDYWSDPYKLQKQVDFLEYHKEYIGCTAAALTVDENNNITNVIQYWDCRKTLFTRKDLDGFSMPSLNQALVHRNIFLDKKYDYSFYTNHNVIGDTMTLAFLTCQGDIFRMPEIMLCYRRLNSPKGTNAMSQVFKDSYRALKYLDVLIELEKFVKKNYKKKLLSFSKAKNIHISNSIITSIKYPDKTYLKRFLKTFIRYPNKFEFIAISIKTIINGTLKFINQLINQHRGVLDYDKIKTLPRNPSIIENSQFDLSYCSIDNDSNVGYYPIPKWREYRLPGEKPYVEQCEDGLLVDASAGNVRLRQVFSTKELSNKWVTFSVCVLNGCIGSLRLFFFDEQGMVMDETEFLNPQGGKILYLRKKIPTNCRTSAVQFMIQSDETLKISYVKLEIGKKATLI